MACVYDMFCICHQNYVILLLRSFSWLCVTVHRIKVLSNSGLDDVFICDIWQWNQSRHSKCHTFDGLLHFRSVLCFMAKKVCQRHGNWPVKTSSHCLRETPGIHSFLRKLNYYLCQCVCVCVCYYNSCNLVVNRIYLYNVFVCHWQTCKQFAH